MTLKKLLIRGNNWLGDAVMSLPLLEALHARLPEAQIDALSKESLAELYRLLPYINNIYTFPDRTGLRQSLAMSSRIKPVRYDACLILPRSFASSLIPYLAGIPMRIGYRAEGRSLLLTHPVKRDPRLLRTHRVHYYMNLSAPLFAPSEPVMPRVTPSTETEAWCDSILGSLGIASGTLLVGLNVGAAYGTAKQWRLERYAQVARRLIEKFQARILYFGSQKEFPQCDLAQKATGPASFNLAGKTTLSQLAGLIRRCRVFLTNDTGPMHVASLMDVPLVAVFGSTDPVTTSPFTLKWTMIRREVECSPCLLRTCPIDHRCMERITVDDVVRAAESWLEQPTGAAVHPQSP